MVAKTTSLACYTTQARELILFIILEELLFSQPYELVLTANIEHWDCVSDFKEFLGKITLQPGTQTGDFQISDVGATGRVLIDCYSIVSALVEIFWDEYSGIFFG
ncbi:MAG: hypothetical protein JO313_00920 [Verrucomicrobia bacterium]|nr:hypothetical protein [Verrucomicrobiota bacterium]